MPATRHPVTEKKITATGSTTTANRPLTGEPAPSPAAAGNTKPRRSGLQSPDSGATFKVTLYVDRATDEFMEAARVEGLTSRPKVDVSRSAVVRLALRRLMDDMSPGEVKTLLIAQAVRSIGPGRKRR
jgi:hypothetical protein